MKLFKRIIEAILEKKLIQLQLDIESLKIQTEEASKLAKTSYHLQRANASDIEALRDIVKNVEKISNSAYSLASSTNSLAVTQAGTIKAHHDLLKIIGERVVGQRIQHDL